MTEDTDAPPGATTSTDPPSDARSIQELRRASSRGIRVLLASRVLFEIGGFLATLVVARLITPADLGRASIALFAPVAATILTYEGFSAALVQREAITEAHIRTSTALGAALGIALSIAWTAAAATIAPGLFDPQTAHLLLVVAPVFALAGLITTSRALMQRRLLLAELASMDVKTFLLSTTVTLALAAAGTGAYSLVVGAVAGTVFQVFASWRIVAPARPGFDRTCARELTSFGVFASIAGLAFVLRRSLPYAVLAAVASPQTAGIFARAFQATAENQAKVTGILLQVSFPLMARTESLDDMQRIRRRMVSANALAVLPLLAILAGAAPGVITLLYGPQWHAAAAPGQVLVLAGAALALSSGAEAMAFARNRPQAVVVYNVVSLLAVIVAVVIGAPGGLMAISVAIVVAYVFQLLFAQWWIVRRVGGLPMRSLITDAAPAVVASLVVAGVSFAAYPILEPTTGILLGVALTTALGLAVYVAVLRAIWPEQLCQFIGQLRSLRGGGRPTEPAPGA